MCHYKGVPNDQELTDSLGLSRCAVNAETMQWKKHRIVKTSAPKTVHIVGGGIGGMETARVLKLRGHEPVIHERLASSGERSWQRARNRTRGSCATSCLVSAPDG